MSADSNSCLYVGRIRHRRHTPRRNDFRYRIYLSCIDLDELDRVSEALAISHRSRAIALQSVIAGMGMSFVAMLAGASGLLVPVAGAMVQELIDVLKTKM